MSRTTLFLLVFPVACSGSPQPAPTRPSRSYGYETDEEPGHNQAAGSNCTVASCHPPLVCLDVSTDTTLAVATRELQSFCVSPESDFCKHDPAACSPARSLTCSIDDLTTTDDEYRTILQNIARRCKPLDQCLLACIRSGCAAGVGGGCFHMCGLRGIPPAERDTALLREAERYRGRTHYLCQRQQQDTP